MSDNIKPLFDQINGICEAIFGPPKHISPDDARMMRCYSNSNEPHKCLPSISELQAQLAAANARIALLERVAEAAQSASARWYRKPQMAEGGDFLADMHRLKKALAALNEESTDD